MREEGFQNTLALEEIPNRSGGFCGRCAFDKVEQNVFLSARNLPHVLVLETQEVDPVSLVRFENVLLTKAAVTQFEELLG